MKRGNTHHSEKVGHSLFSFLDTLKKETSYCRKYVNFILVYNEEKNKYKNNKLPKDGYQLSKQRQNLKSKLPGIKRNIPLFQMGRYEGVYFKKVYTYSKEDFEKFVSERLPV